MKPDELRFANVLADAIGKRVADVLASVAKSPGDPAQLVSAQIRLFSAQSGTRFRQFFHYTGRCPGLHTFYVRSDRGGAAAAANRNGVVVARLEFWLGNRMQFVDFDITEGGAVVTVPCDNAYVSARWLDTIDANTWPQADVTAFAIPGSAGQRSDLTLTTPSFTVPANGDSPIAIVPPYAWGVTVQGRVTLFEDANTSLQFREAADAASAFVNAQRMRTAAAPGAGQVSDANIGNPIPLGGATQAVLLTHTAAGTFTDTRFVFHLRV